jgi:hypothetical protein
MDDRRWELFLRRIEEVGVGVRVCSYDRETREGRDDDWDVERREEDEFRGDDMVE